MNTDEILAETKRLQLEKAAPELLEALKEFIGDDSADIHTARCATQPPWMRGCAEQGPCDCRYGRARAAIKLAEEGKAP